MLDEIVDFVQLVDIGNVIIHEERGRRIEWNEDEKASREFPFSNNSLGLIVENRSFHYRFRAISTDEYAEYVTDVEIVYVTERDVRATERLLTEFAERVAFMAVYPFIRASIYGSATRLGLPAPVLSIIRQGEFTLGVQLTDEQLHESFGDTRSEVAQD
jgi:hypothetical protein